MLEIADTYNGVLKSRDSLDSNVDPQNGGDEKEWKMLNTTDVDRKTDLIYVKIPAQRNFDKI